MLANTSRNGYRHISGFRQSYDALAKFFDEGTDVLQSLLFVAITNKHTKLFTAESTRDIVDSEHVGNQPSCEVENNITSEMSVSVIDQLEEIYIDHHNRKQHFFFSQLFRGLKKGPSIEEPSEWVSLGALSNFALLLLLHHGVKAHA